MKQVADRYVSKSDNVTIPSDALSGALPWWARSVLRNALSAAEAKEAGPVSMTGSGSNASSGADATT